MNLRTLKKHCKRAVPILIRDHGYKTSDFTPAEGDETVDTPHGMEKRHEWRGFLRPGPLKGTPLLWCRVSHEYDEWEARLPSEWLKEIEFWADFKPSENEARNETF